MATKKVILYFENQEDALRFTLAAGSFMAEADQPDTGEQAMHVLKPLARATRIRVSSTASCDEDTQSAAKAG